jgi:hypothetical protein
MSRKLTDGAETGDVSFWDAVQGFTASTEQKRSGSYSYRANYRYANKNIDAVSEFFFRFALHGHAAGWSWLFGIPQWISGGTILGSLGINPATGKLHAYVNGIEVGVGLKALNLTQWYVVELHVLIGDSGLVEVKVDGISDISYSGDTKPGAASTVDLIRFWSDTAATLYYLDDLALNDTTGSQDYSWCGDGHVIYLPANANGDTSQLTGQDGNSTDNYLNVDDIPSDGDTSYNEGSSAELYDLYNLAACGLASSAVILRVIPICESKDTVAVGGKLALMIKTDGSEYTGPDVTLLNTYSLCRGDEYQYNPATAEDWTPTSLDALQVGVKVKQVS